MLFQVIKKNYYIIILIFFSIGINQYFGNKGVFPVDSFAFFDTGFRVLNNQLPFRDYWVVSGPFIDYFQSVLFFIFGINWQSYVFHASIFNALISVATFIFLKEFKLKELNCFFYSICFSILAYPSSGTPFVDHHSAFLSLLAIYFLILGIKKNKKIYWISLPYLIGFAFLSKQVPAVYFCISLLFILVLFFLNNKKNLVCLISFIKSSISFIILFVLFILISKTQFINFVDQYLFYPTTIGTGRYENYQITVSGAINHFKFIYLALLPYLIISLREFSIKKKYFKRINFYKFLGIILSVASLILHQILTKNQTFIFFLIPLLIAISHTELQVTNLRYKKLLIFALLFLCVFTTIKYNKRFNIDRKFHELNHVNFKNAADSQMIDKKFFGLKWITPKNKSGPLEEINSINQVRTTLKQDRRNKMLITHYSFFSVLLDENLHAPNRWYPLDGSAFPTKDSKFFTNYKNFFLELLIKNEIEVIYIMGEIPNSILYNYINKNCFKEKIILNNLSTYLIKKDCSEFNIYN